MITENSVGSDEVIINAPVELVWDILLDFANYPEWNTFCPQIKNESLEMGAAVDMMIDLGGEGLTAQTEYICKVDPQACIAWRMENKTEDPVHAIRSQFLQRIDDNSCSYHTIDEIGRAHV